MCSMAKKVFCTFIKTFSRILIKLNIIDSKEQRKDNK